jgi:hypothetical protein
MLAVREKFRLNPNPFGVDDAMEYMVRVRVYTHQNSEIKTRLFIRLTYWFA